MGRSSSPGKSKIFSPVHVVQTCSGVHPASYPMGSFPRGKVEVKNTRNKNSRLTNSYGRVLSWGGGDCSTMLSVVRLYVANDRVTDMMNTKGFKRKRW
jgi:hypothetical protein